MLDLYITNKTSNMCLMFLEVASAHQGCIYLIKNTFKIIIVWNIIKISNLCE